MLHVSIGHLVSEQPDERVISKELFRPILSTNMRPRSTSSSRLRLTHVSAWCCPVCYLRVLIVAPFFAWLFRRQLFDVGRCLHMLFTVLLVRRGLCFFECVGCLLVCVHAVSGLGLVCVSHVVGAFPSALRMVVRRCVSGCVGPVTVSQIVTAGIGITGLFQCCSRKPRER